MSAFSPLSTLTALKESRASYAALAAPLAAALIAGATGNQTALVFALGSFCFWLVMYWFPEAITETGGTIVRRLKCTPMLAFGFAVIVLFAIARDPASSKIIYSLMTLACLVASLGGALLHWTDRGTTWRDIAPQFVTLCALFVWLLYGESDWYVVPVTPTGVPHTVTYLTRLPLWWWGLCMALPAAGLLLRLRAAPSRRTSFFHQPILKDASIKRALVTAALLILFLMAALQTLDFIQPRLGRAIFEGDDFTYLTNVYQLLERGEFTPFHMPLISIYLALIYALAGESSNAILFTNGALILLTVALALYALWLISSDMRLVLLGGLLLVSLRTLYMFVWTSLTETLNDVLWVAAIVGLLTVLRRPSFPAHIWFGLITGLLLLARSQNIGGILGLGVAYFILVLFIHGRPLRAVALVMVMVAAAAVPLVAWGKYQESVHGRFQIMDGRGAGVFLGMNMPNVSNGMDAGAWTVNLDAWQAEHPNATSTDMLIAGLRYRIERPAETAHYYSQRTLEMLNFRFSWLMGWPVSWALKPNLQLVIALFACFLLFFTPARWIGVMVWAIFVPFLGIFIAIYAEARYRIPMDSLLTIGAAVAMAQAAFKVPVAWVEKRERYLFGPSRRRIFVAVLVTSLILVGVLRAIDVAPLSGRASTFVTGKLVPEGSTLSNGPPAEMASYRNLTDWNELMKTNHPADIQGAYFRGRFRLIGSLFRVGNKNEYKGLFLPEDEYYRADLPVDRGDQHVKIDRLAISFNGAVIEDGIKQRGIVDIVGRVRKLPNYYQQHFERTRFVLIDAIYAQCADAKATAQPDPSNASRKPSLC